MAECISPFVKDGYSLPCGKCLDCKGRRVSNWSFRLLKEAEVSDSAFFVTLTYDNVHCPLTARGYMTLDKTHVQKFLKRLRKIQNEKFIGNKKVSYYAAGEYGGHTFRPHYHIIMFNVDTACIDKAWGLGSIHYGQVNEATVGYTLKYISKGGSIPVHRNDDREKEFSLMSKKMGISYLTPEMREWHEKDILNRMYVNLPDGKKAAMPRYYKEKIYTQADRQMIGENRKKQIDVDYSKLSAKEKVAKDEKDRLVRIEKARKNQEQRQNLKL